MIQDIHDIRPPVMAGIDPDLIRMGIWVGAGLLVLALGVLAVRAFIRSRKPKTPVAVTAHLSPYDGAVRDLDRLGITPVVDARAFYFDLGHILKAYLGGRFGFNGLEMTTQELARALRSINGMPGELRTEVSLFQDLCDPFRYAPMEPDQARRDQDLRRARDLVAALEKAACDAEAPAGDPGRDDIRKENGGED